MTHFQALKLAAGDPGPLQQSGVSCGSACLTVARMMIDPELTRWILTGVGPGGRTDSRSVAARFAEHEQLVLARTNRVTPWPGSLQAPWPRALGTPPWGAQAELEHGASLDGVPYAITVLRHLSGTPCRAPRGGCSARSASARRCSSTSAAAPCPGT